MKVWLPCNLCFLPRIPFPCGEHVILRSGSFRGIMPQVSFHPSGKFSSRIDMIWAPLVLEQSISDCQYHTSFFSDHRYMLLKFHLGDVFARGPGVWKFNTSLLDSPEYCARGSLFLGFWKPQEASTFSSSLYLVGSGEIFPQGNYSLFCSC